MSNNVSAHAASSSLPPTEPTGPRQKADAIVATQALTTSSSGKINAAICIAQIDDWYKEREDRINTIYESQVPGQKMTKLWIQYAFVSDIHQKLREKNPNSRLKAAQDEVRRLWEEAGCKTFAEYRELITEDGEETRVRENLAKKRTDKHVSVKSSNLANMGDVLKNCDKIQVMFEGLYERCNAPAFAVVSKGNAADVARPQALFTGGAEEFLMDVFNVSTVEFMWRFEAYFALQSRKPRAPKTITMYRREIVRLTVDGLKLVVRQSNVKMYYKHYDYGIRYLLGVELHGLLEGDDQPVNPTQITDIGRLQQTLERLQTGNMHWKKMSKSDHTKLKASMDAKGDRRLRDARKSSSKTKSPETVDDGNDLSEEEPMEVDETQGGGWEPDPGVDSDDQDMDSAIDGDEVHSTSPIALAKQSISDKDRNKTKGQQGGKNRFSAAGERQRRTAAKQAGKKASNAADSKEKTRQKDLKGAVEPVPTKCRPQPLPKAKTSKQPTMKSMVSVLEVGGDGLLRKREREEDDEADNDGNKRQRVEDVGLAAGRGRRDKKEDKNGRSRMENAIRLLEKGSEESESS
ncbi:hypothetical protein GGX14DRAFT_567844 [Mycena pura]|uniref:Uncharacterized protein n=1 Tax=Mycena pura TaxID=153505 RepID=A0AAD6VA40_9AGAR|nr:hypothetical protein GGX14DRAFT_567844 [Mycena pura]